MAGLPHREHRVEVDVRLDEGRRDQGAAEVDDLGGLLLRGHDEASPRPNFDGFGTAGQAGAAKEQIEHSTES